MFIIVYFVLIEISLLILMFFVPYAILPLHIQLSFFLLRDVKFVIEILLLSEMMNHHEAEEIKLGLDLSYKQNIRNLYVASDSMITSKTCKVIRLVRDIIYKFENM